MIEQRYILTIQNNNIFKEIDISKDTSILKIGTLQDSDVRLKHELFDFPISVILRFESGVWRISCADGMYISSETIKDCDGNDVAIHHGDILNIHNTVDKTILFTLSFSYDFTVNAANFDTIIDIRNINNLIIGNYSKAQLKLSSQFIGSEYLVLTRVSDNSFSLDASHAQNSATLNGIRVFGNAVINEFDFIGIADYSFYFKNQVLYTSVREDLRVNGINFQSLRDETPAFNYPQLNKSPRMLYSFNTEPIEILNPPQKPDKPRDNLVLQLSPALLMIAVTVITRSGLIGGLNTGNPAFLVFSLSIMAVGILTSILSFVYNRRRYKKDIAEWNADYSAYIIKKRQEIKAERIKERSALVDTYPETEKIRDFVKTFSGRLFERSSNDGDFLHIRVGLGSVPALRGIKHRQEEHIKIDNELMQIPEQMCSEYEFIDKAPVMLHLRESGTIGVIGSLFEQYEFFKNILLNICVQHDYDEVQVIVLLPQNEQNKYEWIKWFPHIKESGDGLRGIVCDDESRDTVFEYLYSLLNGRSVEITGNEKSVILPYIVVFVLEEYGIKTHPLSKFAFNSARLGLSFVYFKQYAENLPQYCSEIVELDTNRGVLRLRNDKMFSRPFIREQVKDESIKFIAERLAPVFYEKIALSSRLTSNITLFKMLNIISPEDLDLTIRWSKSNVQKSLAAPLGVDVKGETLNLDLHEKAHGPHGLVAGTTGSGKSEIMQTYILSAAVNFHPYEVSFVIIDFKGGGMANQFENLPHLIGKITDIDSHEINRSLLSIRAELAKRKRLFAEYEVNHIDQYIAKYKSKIAKVPLPHLILIVDEFAELKAEQPEFMKELISTARVGRSLGIHLILATQKPAGQVSEQIWSNSRFKLCLKVATKEDSNEVLKSPLASEILEPGRAYLQVGNNEIFTLFQSAYSGASAVSDNNGNIREFVISEMSFTGKRTVVYENNYVSRLKKLEKIITDIDSLKDYTTISQLKMIIEDMDIKLEDTELSEFNKIVLDTDESEESKSNRLKGWINKLIISFGKNKLTQLKAMVDYINKYCENASIPRLQNICLPPLPEIINYKKSNDVLDIANLSNLDTVICVGIYDDPGNQVQPAVNLNLLDGNIMIIGSAQTGKTMLLQTVLRGIAEQFAPKRVSVYILDFASKIMKIYENLNHIGDVLTDSDDEKLKNFFKMMRDEIDDRKEQFSRLGISSYEAYLDMNKSGRSDILPHIIIMIDNLSVFKEIFQDYEDAMLNICREGLALGITVIATAKQTSGLSYKYFSNFATRIAFNCTESSEYGIIFDKCQIRPKNIQGRGLVAIDKIVYEYQAYLPFIGETESERNDEAKKFINEIAGIYGKERARTIPSIPRTLNSGYWNSAAYKFDKYVIPIGLTYNDIETVSVDLAHTGSIGIYGREKFGKSNMIRLIMAYLQQHVFDLPSEAYLIDGYDRQLSEFETYGFVQKLTVDCSDFEEIVQKFSDAVKERMDIMRMGGNLENEPLLLCIIQNSQIFGATTIPKAVSDQFKKLIVDAKQLKICFIFSNIDNNPDISSPDMMRIARDLSQYFLLDDLVNVKLFGTGKFTANDLKPYRKAISLGDGYTYDVRNGIDKVKIVKCERSL